MRGEANKDPGPEWESVPGHSPQHAARVHHFFTMDGTSAWGASAASAGFSALRVPRGGSRFSLKSDDAPTVGCR